MPFPNFADWLRAKIAFPSSRNSRNSWLRPGVNTAPLDRVEALEQRVLLAQNVAPTLNSAGAPYLIAPVGSRMAPDAHNGILISDLLARGAGGRPISDPDAGALQGIALTAIDKSVGTWQFTLAANPQATDWTNVEVAGAISNSSALLLPADTTTRLRFVTTLLPSHGGDGYLLLESKLNAGITFRAWDRTTGTAGGRANTSTNGGSTAFSTTTETAATYFETRLFRSFNPTAHLNVYSLEPEFNVLTTTFGYEDRSTPEYTGFTIFLSPIPDKPMAPLYRMYYGVQFNPDGTETDMGYRYLTTNADEARILEGLGPADKRAQRDGTYFRELGVNHGTGITGYIYSSPQPGTTEIQQVYRRDKVDKPNRIGGTLIQTTPVRQDIGDHVYTTKSDFETSKQGTWQKEAPRGFVRELTPYAGEAGITVLAERGQFESFKTIPVTVGATSGTRTLQFDIDTFIDRTSTSSKVEDTLLVSLVSNSGTSNTLLDRGVQGTTLFTYSGGQADYPRGIVRFDGRTVEIDVSNVKGATSARLLFQLLNHDADDGTLVVIHPLKNLVNTGGVAATAFASDRNMGTAGGAINLAGLSPAPNLHAQIDNIRFDDATGKYQADLAVENTGPATGSNVVALFEGLPTGVALLNPSGLNASGVPYLNLRPVIPGGGLGTGLMSQRVQVAFSNPNHIRFPILPTILAGPANRPPVLAAVGPLSVMPGGVLKVALSASDPDGDPLTLSLQPTGSTTALPTGGLSADGTLVFRPLPGEVGTYQFNIVASDGASQTTRPTTLTVVPDPVKTTRISGVIQKTNGQPLAGVTVQVGAVQGLTAADGSFLLNLGSGPLVSDSIKIRADMLPGSVKYPFIAEKLPLLLLHNVYAGVNNVIDRPIYLPALDLANAKTINPNVDTNVTTSALPGISVLVKAGTLMNQQGTPFTGKLSITEVPVALTPAALPNGLLPDLVVTIQPGEMAFAAPAPMTFPNRAGWAPGTLMDLWSINPVTGQFEDVGDMRVSADGTSIQTISGGVRNSSWHFASPASPPPPDGENPRNEDLGCTECAAAEGLTSQVELHSGAVIETHNLVSYQSQEIDRGVSLTYDSLRADPRPIVHVGLTSDPSKNLLFPSPVGSTRFVTELRILDVPYEAPLLGNVGELVGLSGEENFWSYSSTARIDVALQADLSHEPSGVYQYRTRTGFLRPQDGTFTGTLKATVSSLISVNSIDSPFGAGWGLSGLQSLVVTKNGSVLLIDGDGSERFYQRDSKTGKFLSPPGDFSKLERVSSLFRLTTPEQTVYQFNADHQIQSITDRLGNKTTYNYLSKRLTGIVDPVGLMTTFTYTGAHVTTITDPAGRKTLLTYDVQGNLTSVTDPDTAKRTWEYDALHHMTAEVDPLNRREETEYGFHGRAIGAVRKDGSTVQVHPTEIDALLPPQRTKDHNNPPSIFVLGPAEAQYTEGNGNVIRTRLDRAGQAVGASDNIGNLPTELRNASNLPTQTIDARGNRSNYTYDPKGNLLTFKDSLSGQIGSLASADYAMTVDGEVHHFSFTGKTGQRIFLDGFVHTNGMELSFTSPDGDTIELVGDATGTRSRAPLILLRDGAYSLTVTGRKDATYSFRIVDLDTVPVLPVGSLVSGQIKSSDGLFYRFEGTRGQRLTLTESFTGTGTFFLYGEGVSSYREILSDSAGPGGNGFTVVLPDSGTYTLALFPNATGATPGSYGFRAALANPATVAKSGLDVEHAGTLATQQTQTFALSAPAGTMIHFNQFGTGFPSYSLQDNSSQLEISLTTAVVMLPTSGAYTLKVTNNGSLTTDFAFRVQDLTKPAALATIGSSLTGTLLNGRDAAYRFIGRAGQRIDYGPNDFNAPGRVYFATGTEVTDPDGGVGPANASGIHVLPRDGEYFLIVSGFSASPSYAVSLADASAATLSPLDTVFSGQLPARGGRKYFTFESKSGDTLFLDDLGSSPTVKIYGRLLGSQSLASADQNLPILPSYQNTIPRYTYAIDAAESDRPATYRFRVLSAKTTTTAMTLGAVVTGSISQPNETDVYTFAGSAGQRVYFDGRSTTVTNTTVRLYAPSGIELTSGLVVPGESAFAVDGDSGNPRILRETGTYKLVVKHAHDNQSSPSLGTYSFRLSEASQATPITLGTPLNAGLPDSSTARLYRFSGTAGQRLQIDQVSSGASVEAKFFSPAGVLLSTTMNGDVKTVTLAETGSYLLVVRWIGSPVPGAIPFDIRVTNVANATVVVTGLDKTYSGSGSPTGQDVLAATFQGNAGQKVFFDVLAFAQGTVAKVFDPANNLVGSFGALFADDRTFVLPVSGAYSVKIVPSVAGAPTGNYSFKLHQVATAPALSLGTTVSGSIDVLGAIDLFQFNGTAGQQIYIDEIASALHITVNLFDPSGARVVYNTALQGFSGNVDLLTLPTNGKYLVTVRRADVSGGLDIGAYKFKLHDLTVAPSVQLDSTISGTAMPATQAVAYRFEGFAGQRILFDEKADGGLTWDLLSPAFTHVAYLGGTSEKAFLSPVLPATGTYTLLHDIDLTNGANSTGIYKFQLSEFSEQSLAVGGTAQQSGTGERSFTYDPKFNQLLSETDELGQRTLNQIDPANGNVLASTQVVGALGGSDDVVTRFTYTPRGQVDVVTDPMGTVADHDYDSRGRLIAVTEAKGEPAQGIQRTEYDSAGNVTATIDENGHRTEFVYDSMNRLKVIKDALGKLSKFDYDLAGNMIAVTDALGHMTRVEYDARDRLSKIVDPRGAETRCEYDDSGDLLSVTDALGHVTQFEYDARDRPTQSIDPIGSITKFTYDLDNNLTSVTDALGNRTVFTRDARGRVIKETDPLGKVTSYEYNPVDDLVAVVDRLGRRKQYAYDDLHLLVSETWVGANHVTRFEYDKAGLVTSVSDSTGTLDFTYDERDRITQVLEDRSAGAPDSILDYTYDTAGNELSVRDTINGRVGGTNAYRYDALNRVQRITQAGAGIAPKRVDLAYNAVGQLATIARFSDVSGQARVATSNYTYDALNRMTQISHQNGAGSTLDFFNYLYDAGGQITQITDVDGPTNYSYDLRNQLTGASHADAANPDETYAYDATGNRTSSQRHGSGYVVGDGVASTRDNNRLTSDGTYRYAYDAEGNLVTRTHIASGAVREFSWDYRNRLVSVTDRPSASGAPTQIVTYTYDALNRRIAKNVDKTPGDGQDGRVTYFIYDADDVLVELTDPDGTGPQPATETSRLLHGPDVDQVFAMEDFAGNVLWTLTDQLGTVQDLVNNNGSVANHLKYDSYGNVISQTNPAADTRYRYTGREFDAETGLQYNRARYYDAAIGRFISEDPIKLNAMDSNAFRYVRNLPISLTDPSGRDSFKPSQEYINHQEAIKKQNMANASDAIAKAAEQEAMQAHTPTKGIPLLKKTESANKVLEQMKPNAMPAAKSVCGLGKPPAPRLPFRGGPGYLAVVPLLQDPADTIKHSPALAIGEVLGGLIAVAAGKGSWKDFTDTLSSPE